MSFRPRIKICGITRTEDAQMASRWGADAIGMVLYPPSPRSINPEQIPRIIQNLYPWTVPVAVTVDPDDELLDKLTRLSIRWVQLSGMEPPERVAEIRKTFKFRIIKTFHVTDNQDFDRIKTYPPDAIDLYLFDTARPGSYGGTGEPFDWSILESWAGGPFLLAGGLDAQRIQQFMSRYDHPHLFGFDLSSRLESSPGVKDPSKMKEIFRLFRPGGRYEHSQ